MRGIKFRVWAKDYEKMYYGVSMLSAWDNDITGYRSETDHSTYMQYTGLKDKNGKEIYEGDVVKDSRVEDDYGIDVIEWGRYGFVCRDYDEEDNALEFPECWEVLGNIYEKS